MTQQIKPNHNNLSLHKYVLICVGSLFLFIASFPIAYWRVSQSDKYDGLPFKSLELEDHQKSNPVIVNK